MLIVFLPHIFSIITTFLLFNNIEVMSNSHILLSLISYAVLLSAFILSFMMSYQIKQLKNHNISFIKHFPALQTSEKVLFWTIYIGFILLSIAILNGFMEMQDIFAQHLAHKSVFAIIAWLLLLGLIILRLSVGLSDKNAITAVQISFILIIIGYFGTKIALFIIY